MSDVHRWDHPTAVHVQFQNLLNFLISEFPEMYCNAKEKLDAVEFWVHLMNHESIPWENVIKELIYTILIIPVGTSDIERGFSVLNHFLTKRRSVLSTKHIGAFTSIRVGHLVFDVERYRSRGAMSWQSRCHWQVTSAGSYILCKKKRYNKNSC